MIIDNFSTDKIKRVIGEDFYYTELTKKLQKQLKDIMQMQPMPVEVPPNIEKSDEMAYDMASPGAQQVISDKIMAEKSATEAQLMQQQIAMIQAQAMQVQQQLKNVMEDEQDFWVQFEKERRELRYDCTVDETASNPTYRFAIAQQLQEWQKYGVQVPFGAILKYMDIPKSDKEEWKAEYEQQRQAMMQMQQQQSQKTIKLQHGGDGSITGGSLG
jgi:hypothetical protein